MMKTFTMLGTLLVALTLANPVLARTLDVDCNKRNKTITKALTKAKPGDTIRVSGTCHEIVIITTDRLTLEGRDDAVIDGNNVDLGSLFGLLTVDGAQGVVLTGHLTVQNSARIGMIVINNAQAFFRGNFVSQGNASHGILVFTGGSARFKEGTVDAIDNGGDGLVVANGASAIIPLIPPDAFTLTSNGNRRGIHLSNGGSFQAIGGAINAADNQIHGIRAAYGANLFMAAGVQVSLQRNSQGLSIESNAQALVMSPTTITDNATAGVSVQAGFIDLRGATITDNGPTDDGLDVDLGFGTRAHLTGNTIDILHCDETVLLSPGTDPHVVCPTP